MENIKIHPFQKTLGDGPYKFVGAFSIKVVEGRGVITTAPHHPRFVRGSGTCSHCGMAIMNVFEVQIGNGDVYGVGSDCIMKVGMEPKEIAKVKKEISRHQKTRRDSLAAEKKAKLPELLESCKEKLVLEPHSHPYHASQGKTMYDYWVFVVKNSHSTASISKTYSNLSKIAKENI